MSKQLWELVLEKSAKQFRDRPAMWHKGGFGTAQNPLARADSGKVSQMVAAGQVTACIDTMIRLQSLIIAGDRSEQGVAERAISELCAYHGLKKDSNSIIDFNDGPGCRSAEDAAAFIEAFLEKKPSPYVTGIRLAEHA